METALINKHMKKKEVWDALAWIVLGLMALWLILKVLGVINTPLWLQYSPLFGAIYLAGWGMHKLKNVADDIGNIKKEVKEIDRDVHVLRLACPKLKE